MSSTQTNLDSITTQSGQPGSALSVPTPGAENAQLEAANLETELKAANLETEELKAELEAAKLELKAEKLKVKMLEEMKEDAEKALDYMKEEKEKEDAEKEKKKVDVEKKKVEMTAEFYAVLSKEKLEELKKKKLEELYEKALKELYYMKEEKEKEDAEKEKKKVDAEKKKEKELKELYEKEAEKEEYKRKFLHGRLGDILRYNAGHGYGSHGRSSYPCSELMGLKVILYLFENSVVCPDHDPRDMVIKGIGLTSDRKPDGTLKKDFTAYIRPGKDVWDGFCPGEWVRNESGWENFTKDKNKLFIYTLAITLGLMVNGRFPIGLTDGKGGGRPSQDATGYGTFIDKFHEKEFRHGTTESFKTLVNKFVNQSFNPDLVQYSIPHAIDEITKLIATYGGDYTIGASRK